MIESTLEFSPTKLALVVDALLSLPTDLRPTRYRVGEDDRGAPVPDRKTLVSSQVGFFLVGAQGTFDLRCVSGPQPLICDAYLEDEPDLAESFLIHMAAAQPIFGLACAREEYLHRNRVVTKQGMNTIESWVGRNTKRYIPGFYWLTLLPEALAEQHGVPESERAS